MSRILKEQFSGYSSEEPVRLNKFLSDAGFCSRREADRLIEAGEVRVNKKTAALGTKVSAGDTVECRGKELKRNPRLILIAFNKPAGIECTAAKDSPCNIIDFINYPERIYPVGRLDKYSTGLILLTNAGELANEILKSVNRHEKEYIVKVNKNITDDFIAKMSNGVYLEGLGRTTRPCEIKKISSNEFSLILTQGLNRQIRRMCEALQYKVISLKRIRIMNIRLGSLKEGTYRNVTEKEVCEMFDKCL